jgi:general secretion pathway protein N
MTRYGPIAGVATAFLVCGGLGALIAATPPAGLEAPESTFNTGTMDPTATPDRAAVPNAREHALTGNPLWAIPLRVLTATRERPLFSPSRRPPAPAVVAAPPPPRPAPTKPPEPDHPLLTIVGTIVSETDSIGVFIDQATNDVIRLHTGQDHDGWTLRAVQRRETIFEKDSRKATLALPTATQPTGSPAGPNPPMQTAAPVPAAAPVGNTWMDGDGQLIAPPARRTFEASGPPGRPR